MSKQNKIILVIALFVLPIVGRSLWFYRDFYQAPELPNIEKIEIDVPETEFQLSLDERPISSSRGVVLVDLSHDNNLEIDDLSPLRDRLLARGVTVETRTSSSDSLEFDLRGVLALVIVAPTDKYSSEELQTITEFVDAGGRLLLAADPTRPVPVDSYYLDDYFFPESAIPVINSLANPFGVNYFDDYIYNLHDNAGNYRNVRLVINDDGNDLTKGIDSVVVYAAHSLQSEGVVLLSGDENTLSPLRTGETDLAAAVLAEDGQVLALGDVTFLTPPFFTVEDNEIFISNIADWLVTAEREWDLIDFPYFFTGPVDMVPMAEGALDPRLIVQSSELASIFDEVGLEFGLREKADRDHDVFYIGTFEDSETVEHYLNRAGIVVLPDEDNDEDEDGNPLFILEIDDLGQIKTAGTTLFLADLSDDQVVMVVMGVDLEAAIKAGKQLAAGDLEGCIIEDTLIICSAGDAPEEEEEEEEEDSSSGYEGAANSPKFASKEDAEDAFTSFSAPFLTELAAESYDEIFVAGETYTYTIELEESEDVLWLNGWCADTEEIMEQNMEHIVYEFTMNGEDIPLDAFIEDSSYYSMCTLYYALLTDWPDGEHLLTKSVTFTEEVDDGMDVYPEGTYLVEYYVTVGE